MDFEELERAHTALAKDVAVIAQSEKDCRENTAATLERIDKTLEESRKQQGRIIVALIVLFTAIAGSEGVLQAMGHTPPLDLAFYILAGLAYTGLSLYLLFIALARPNGEKPFIFVALFLITLSTFVEIAIGFGAPSEPMSLGVSVPFLLGASLLLFDAWHQFTEHRRGQ